jgi:predicted DNA binding CopG/RHH family protein
MANKNVPSLDGLIQTKGAPRPDTMSQRGESPAREIQTHLQAAVAQSALEPKAAPQPTQSAQAVPAGKEPRAKSLTLRLSESQYERLRRFAFERRLSHQDIIESALLGYLDQQERSA